MTITRPFHPKITKLLSCTHHISKCPKLTILHNLMACLDRSGVEGSRVRLAKNKLILLPLNPNGP